MTIKQNLLEIFSLCTIELCFTFCFVSYFWYSFLHFASFTLHLMFFTSWGFLLTPFGKAEKWAFFFFFFWGRFGAGRFIQPAATVVFSQFRLRVCFKNNLNCKFPPSLSPFPPTTSLAAAASLLFYLFYFFRFLHEANEAWRCVCAAIAVNWYGITYIHTWKWVCQVCVCMCLSACVTSFAWRQSNAIWD